MSALELCGSVVAFLLGSALQSAVGFGAGLLAIPLLLWVGVPLAKAVAMMLGVVTVHAGYNCYRARHDIVWEPLVPITLLRWAGMPAGVLLLERYLLSDQTTAKQAVGAVLLLSIALSAHGTHHPKAQLHAGWLWLAGISSGVLAGAVGMGGPPLVLYALSHAWSSQRTRAYLWTLYLLGTPMVVAIFAWRFGSEPLWHWLLGMAFMPVVWLGSNIGLALIAKHSREALRRVSIAVLALIAMMSIAAPWLRR